MLNDLSMAMPRGILAPAAFNEDGTVNEDYLMDHTPGTGSYMRTIPLPNTSSLKTRITGEMLPMRRALP